MSSLSITLQYVFDKFTFKQIHKSYKTLLFGIADAIELHLFYKFVARMYLITLVSI